MSIHTKTFETHPFFRSLGNRRLLTFIGQCFKQAYYEAGDYIYRQGDEISQFRIITKGIATFVNPRYHNQMFAVIDPKLSARKGKSHEKMFYHCGFEDTVVNHLFLIKELEMNKNENKKLENKIDSSMLSRRAFTV